MPGHLYEDEQPTIARPRRASQRHSSYRDHADWFDGRAMDQQRARDENRDKTKMLGLAAGAAALPGSGYLWSIWFPLNKKMWTSSYVLVAAGWSLLLFALAYSAIEQRGWGKSGASKRILLALAGLRFKCHCCLHHQRTARHRHRAHTLHLQRAQRRRAQLCLHAYVCADLRSRLESAAFSVSYTAVCFLPVWALYRKKIFVKV